MTVSPSILSADFANLGKEIEMLNRSRADMIHVDVMDGVFVPNISFGFPVIKAVAKVATKPIDAHFMITNPQDYIGKARDFGVTIMNVHQEACLHLDRTVNAIIEAGMLPAVTLNPATPVEMLRDIADRLHMVLLMSVNPGFGGQKFIDNTLKKVTRLKDLLIQTGSEAKIEVDGGVNIENGKLLAKAGADILVAGNAIFRSDDPEAYIARLAEIEP